LENLLPISILMTRELKTRISIDQHVIPVNRVSLADTIMSLESLLSQMLKLILVDIPIFWYFVYKAPF